MQKTCPPCRQTMEKYDTSLYVEKGNKRVYVCCSGCAKKMEQYWNGYINFVDDVFHEVLEEVDNVGDTPRTTNLNNKGVCGPCSTGLCMLKHHLPPEAQNTWSASIGNVYGSLFHSPKL